jgi:hypothetical protein
MFKPTGFLTSTHNGTVKKKLIMETWPVDFDRGGLQQMFKMDGPLILRLVEK